MSSIVPDWAVLEPRPDFVNPVYNLHKHWCYYAPEMYPTYEVLLFYRERERIEEDIFLWRFGGRISELIGEIIEESAKGMGTHICERPGCVGTYTPNEEDTNYYSFGMRLQGDDISVYGDFCLPCIKVAESIVAAYEECIELTQRAANLRSQKNGNCYNK